MDDVLGNEGILSVFIERPFVLTKAWVVQGSLWDPLSQQLNLMQT